MAIALSLGVALAGPSSALAGSRLPASQPAPRLAAVAPAAPTQVAVFDRVLRTTTIASHDGQGQPGTASSSKPSMNGDGFIVAFESDANLAPDDANNTADIYLWEAIPNTTRRISLAVGGGKPKGPSRDPSISADGGVVAFSGLGINLTNDPGFDGTTSQVFAWQATTGAIRLVSAAADGSGAANGGSGNASVSADGRVVGFQSGATNLVPSDSNGKTDVFLRDLSRSATILASVDSRFRPSIVDSLRPSVSGDGGAVVFDSTSTSLVPRDTNNVRDVFVRDLPPAVAVSPETLDFGVVEVSAPATQVVTVTSVGWSPVTFASSGITGTNKDDFTPAGDLCVGQQLFYGSTCSIAVLHVPTASGERTATLEIFDNAVLSPQRVGLRGGVPGAAVRLEPDVGPPGIVTILTAINFPRGAQVVVTWDRGITQSLKPVTVGPDGTFQLAVLVFHHDQIGPRQLIVKAAPGGPLFPDEIVPFTVVPSPLQPYGATALEFLAPDLEVIIGRR
jgi:hypothetical protein